MSDPYRCFRRLVDRWHAEAARHKAFYDDAQPDQHGFVASCWQRYVDYDRRADELNRAIRWSPPTPAQMLAELHEALGQPFGVPGAAGNELRARLAREETEELCDELDADNRVGIAHELADVVIVAYGTAHSLGIDLDAVVAEVHAANMSKRDSDGKFSVRADGKVLKGEHYRPPDVAAVLDATDEPTEMSG